MRNLRHRLYGGMVWVAYAALCHVNIPALTHGIMSFYIAWCGTGSQHLQSMFFAAVPLMPIYSRGWYRLRTKVQAHRERARVGTVSWLVLTSLVSHGQPAVSFFWSFAWGCECVAQGLGENWFFIFDLYVPLRYWFRDPCPFKTQDRCVSDGWLYLVIWYGCLLLCAGRKEERPEP